MSPFILIKFNKNLPATRGAWCFIRFFDIFSTKKVTFYHEASIFFRLSQTSSSDCLFASNPEPVFLIKTCLTVLLAERVYENLLVLKSSCLLPTLSRSAATYSMSKPESSQQVWEYISSGILHLLPYMFRHVTCCWWAGVSQLPRLLGGRGRQQRPTTKERSPTL